MTAISITLPKRLSHKLEKLASTTRHPKSHLIRKALEAYLAEHANYHLALTRLRDKDDAVVSSQSLRKQRGL